MGSNIKERILDLSQKINCRSEIARVVGVSRQYVCQILPPCGQHRNWNAIKESSRKKYGIRHVPSQIFWEKINIGNKDDCWEWTRKKTKGGYGQNIPVKIQGEGYSHRIAWTLIKGPIPTGLFVCHSCDNPACCNPFHLWLGTSADNVHDRDQKGRTFRGKRKVNDG